MAIGVPREMSEGDRAFKEARENIKHFGRQMLNEVLDRALVLAYEQHKAGEPSPFSTKEDVRELFRQAATLELQGERRQLAD